jgi:hypothetical protein
VQEVNGVHTVGRRGVWHCTQTQSSSWHKLQMEPTTRTACGRPGVNGGYFDPETRVRSKLFSKISRQRSTYS